MENVNPNNIKIGDTILVEQAWESESGDYFDEFAIVEDIDSAGKMKLRFARKDVNKFLEEAEFFAKDYKPE